MNRSPANATLLLSLAISAAFLMETLDSTIMVAAIPAMAADFGVSPLRMNVAISLYLVTMAATIPASSWFADRFGAKRVFLWAMVAFMATSLGAALSPNLAFLVVMRVFQAIAGALMTPVGRLLLIRTTPKEQLAAAIAWMSTPALIGPVLAPLVGGYLVTYASWPWIFIVKMPFGIAGLFLAARFLPADPETKRYRFDTYGFVLCAGFLAIAQMLLEQLVHRFLPVSLLGASAALLPVLAWAFLRHAKQRQAVVLDLSLLRLRLFRSAFFAGGLSRIGLNALPFLLQLQLQLGFDWSAAKAGWIVLVVAASALLLKPMMRQALAKLGFRHTLFANAMVGAAATAMLACTTANTPLPLLLAIVFVFGVARSLQFNTTNTLLYAEIPKHRQSAGAALGGVGQQIAMALGISVAAVLVAQLQSFGLHVPQHAMSVAMGIVAALTALSGLLFLGLARDDGAEVSHHRIANKTS
jgi:EmrB/QacA subfamily drug resistance transporter